MKVWVLFGLYCHASSINVHFAALSLVMAFKQELALLYQVFCDYMYFARGGTVLISLVLVSFVYILVLFYKSRFCFSFCSFVVSSLFIRLSLFLCFCIVALFCYVHVSY